MEIFRRAFVSKSPLTDSLIHSRRSFCYEQCTSPPFDIQKNFSTKKFSLKLLIQKSTGALLFAQADRDFVEFLFSFVTIPLGLVENLLDSNSTLGSLDNLYRSVQHLDVDKYFRNSHTKSMIVTPSLPPGYLSENQIFSMFEKLQPLLYYFTDYNKHLSHLSTNYIDGGDVGLGDPKSGVSYVKGPGMYMVRDDLTVTPLCLFNSITILEGMQILLADVDEIWIGIGFEEGLKILKAAVTSSKALTKGLGPVIIEQHGNTTSFHI